jgi:Mitochondrial carrier protein
VLHSDITNTTVYLIRSRCRRHTHTQTRIQISTEYAALGMFGTIGKVSGEEGISALWKGVNAAWLREASYTSLRLGLYEPTKVLVGANDPKTATFFGKFLAGSIAGALGSIAGNPFDVLKVRVSRASTFFEARKGPTLSTLSSHICSHINKRTISRSQNRQ